MKNIEIWYTDFTPEVVKSNPDKIFVFADNQMKAGKDFQSIIRGMPNTISLRIKKGPSTKAAAYYSDYEFNVLKNNLFEDLLKIKLELLRDKNIVLTSKGYGNIEKVEQFSKLAKELINEVLSEHLHFDNSTGRRYSKIPSHLEITNGKFANIDELDYNSLSSNEILTNIVRGKKVAISSPKEIATGIIIKLISEKYKDTVVCKVLDCYKCEKISQSDWSILEMCDESRFNSQMFQLQLEYICSMTPAGDMKFNQNYFSEKPKKSDVQETVKEVTLIEEVSTKKEENDMSDINVEILKLLKEINNKLDNLSPKSEVKTAKKLFNKPGLEELLLKDGIKGELKHIEGDKWEITTDTKIIFVEFNKGLLKNSYKVILQKNRN